MSKKIQLTLSDEDFEENPVFIQEVLHALDNANNGDIVSLRWDIIHKEKNDILQKICPNRTVLKTMHQKLKQYRYIDICDKLKPGSYVRWINLKNTNPLYLTNGGIVCSLLFDSDNKESEAVICVKNNMNRSIYFKSHQSLIFQKINPQEDIILQLSKYIDLEE